MQSDGKSYSLNHDNHMERLKLDLSSWQLHENAPAMGKQL